MLQGLGFKSKTFSKKRSLNTGLQSEMSVTNAVRRIIPRSTPAWGARVAAFPRLHFISVMLNKKKKQQLGISSAGHLTGCNPSPLSPYQLHVVMHNCNPSMWEVKKATVSLRSAWATKSKTLSKGKIRTLFITISKQFLFVNRNSKF